MEEINLAAVQQSMLARGPQLDKKQFQQILDGLPPAIRSASAMVGCPGWYQATVWEVTSDMAAADKCRLEMWTSWTQLEAAEVAHGSWVSPLTRELLRALHGMQLGPLVKCEAFLWKEQYGHLHDEHYDDSGMSGRFLVILRFCVEPPKAQGQIDESSVESAILQRTTS
jgi:hypothetical protein